MLNQYYKKRADKSGEKRKRRQEKRNKHIRREQKKKEDKFRISLSSSIKDDRD